MILSKKTTLALVISLFLVGSFLISGLALAQDIIGNLDSAAPDSIKSGQLANAPAFVGAVINGFLAIMSTVFFLLMLYGGWIWMTAQGDTAQVKKAKDLIVAAIIGLIIIGGSYAVTIFFVETINQNK